MNKKRILFVGPYPPPYSGPDVAMKTLLKSKLKDRFDIHHLNTNIRTSNAERGKLDLSVFTAFFKFVVRLLFFLIIRRPKIVYYFVTATRSGWLGRDIWCIFISKLFGVKIAIHMRAGHFRRNYESWNFMERFVVRSACNLVSAGIVQANSLRNQFEGLVPGKKIFSVYNAIDTKVYKNDGVYNVSKNIFFMGHLTHAKGYCDLLKAMPKIIANHPDTRFWIAGTKFEKERNIFFNQITGERIKLENPDEIFAANVKNEYEKKYKYLGVIDEKEKIPIFKKCAIFVLPSYSEGFSMAVLEALSMGRPVICTPVGALSEIIQDGVNGFVVMPGDIDALVEKINVLLSNNDLRKMMGRENHVYVRQTFSVDIIANRLGDLFDNITEPSSSRSGQ